MGSSSRRGSAHGEISRLRWRPDGRRSTSTETTRTGFRLAQPLPDRTLRSITVQRVSPFADIIAVTSAPDAAWIAKDRVREAVDCMRRSVRSDDSPTLICPDFRDRVFPDGRGKSSPRKDDRPRYIAPRERGSAGSSTPRGIDTVEIYRPGQPRSKTLDAASDTLGGGRPAGVRARPEAGYCPEPERPSRRRLLRQWVRDTRPTVGEGSTHQVGRRLSPRRMPADGPTDRRVTHGHDRTNARHFPLPARPALVGDVDDPRGVR